jgi:hypothetical protein
MADPQESPQPSFAERIEEARRAIERKWALIPLTGKVPRNKGWQKSRAATLRQVETWIRQGHNVGLRTGQISGVVVLDDDTMDGSAVASLKLPRTVTVITGSGKRHYYFQAPAIKVGNSVQRLCPGVDIRGDGGQVVFVGSVHPDTAEPYSWAPGLSPDDVELAELPEHILVRLQEAGPQKPTLKLVAGDAKKPRAAWTRIEAYVHAALDNEIDNIHASSEGHRNDTLNKSAFALGQLVGGGYLDRERVRTALAAAASAVGLPDAEARATIESGLSAGEQEPRNLTDIERGEQDTAQEEAKDERPVIKLLGGWLHVATSKAERILLRQHPPVLFQRGTILVRVTLLPEAGIGRSIQRRALILEVTPTCLVDKLTELVHWQRVDRRTGDIYTVDCPERIAKTLLSRAGSWRVLSLIGVIDAPTLNGHGDIVDSEGYDRSTGLYLVFGNQKFSQVPQQPSRDDALAALDKLLWVFKDFPFLEPADRSVAVAAVLTALIRPAVRTAPLFAFRAAKMGSGKSLLADVVSMIATGRPAAAMSQGADENEDKKRMLPILAEGDPVAVIDNIERPFGSAALCSILTQQIWRDRILGKSQTMTLPTSNTTWLATGNNIQFVGDISTRTLVCDLDPKCERPEEREFDINLHHYIPQHRGELVVAGLSILRAYHVAGRPGMGLSVFGRFEEWSHWIRSALVWLGMADPCLTRRRVEDSDPVRAELSELLQALHGHFQSGSFRVSTVLAVMDSNDTLRQAVMPILATAGQGQSQAQCLGLFFQHVQRRPEGGLRLVRGKTTGGAASWRVENV